ncbi:uncharacterized protein An03g00090 [Aspergillus niger]|uniref:Contig An03c0020, genomic contig n=2 Tax=Aspergillus niger TaxID=5061 RepID=A2QFM7_ASPNC|nr:uncharacterized protein An03g00090 [Aspergillus niger]CAK37987.1 unnamed protein product [Aspergillus niger]
MPNIYPAIARTVGWVETTRDMASGDAAVYVVKIYCISWSRRSQYQSKVTASVVTTTKLKTGSLDKEMAFSLKMLNEASVQ